MLIAYIHFYLKKRFHNILHKWNIFLQLSLNNLSYDEPEHFIDEYYNGVSAKRLISDYMLSVSPSQLYKHFSPIEFSDYACKYCDIPMFTDRKSKTNNLYFESDLYCLKCHHTLSKNCNCDNCIK